MSNKKEILFIAPMLYPCVMGGIEVFNYHLIKELQKYYPIRVLTKCNEVSFEDATIFKLKSLKFSKLTLPLSILYFTIKNRKSIRFIYLSHSRNFWTYWIIFIIIKIFVNIKYGFTFHGGGLPNKKRKFPYKLFCKNAEFITGVSERIVEENSKKSNRTITHTPPLLPFDVISPRNKFREKWGIRPTDVVLIYIGSLKPLKAVDSLIEALGIISSKKIQQYKLKVLIAGDGIARKDLEKRTQELNLQDVVKFLGIVERENVNQLYNIADIYTICSEFEGLSISLLEAFANKVPCITSDGPGLIDVSLNNKNTLLFKTRDSVDYANKIELLLNDFQLQTKLKNSATKYYEKNFSYALLINNFRTIFDKID